MKTDKKVENLKIYHKSNYWTKEHCQEESLKYKTIRDDGSLTKWYEYSNEILDNMIDMIEDISKYIDGNGSIEKIQNRIKLSLFACNNKDTLFYEKYSKEYWFKDLKRVINKMNEVINGNIV